MYSELWLDELYVILQIILLATGLASHESFVFDNRQVYKGIQTF